ncbi:MAG: hypothetical protein KAT68_01735 [Bacteroidales bacterium]|nr:hypothetical protein [Bacteroidales bacterium]
MNEIRRFLRYTLPGLTVTLVVFGALWYSGDIPSGLMSSENILPKFIGIFISSGALGYFLANIYFAYRWIFKKCFAINHLSVIIELKEKITIKGPSEIEWTLNDLTLFDAWSILSHYCISHSKEDDKMKRIVDYTEKMVDLTHGLGAMFTGIFIAMVSYLIYGFFSCNDSRIWIVFLILLILSVVYFYAFYRSLKSLQSMSNSAFVTSIMSKFNNCNKKICIYYEKNAITDNSQNKKK